MRIARTAAHMAGYLNQRALSNYSACTSGHHHTVAAKDLACCLRRSHSISRRRLLCTDAGAATQVGVLRDSQLVAGSDIKYFLKAQQGSLGSKLCFVL